MPRDLFDRIKDSNIFSENSHIVLGLSGGPDSMCLFDVITRLRDEMGLGLTAVHVNHHIRPVAADEDQKYVEEVCRKAGVKLKVISMDCEKVAKETGKTTEEAGRDARYAALREAAAEIEKRGVPREAIDIAVAHNADDQVETVIHRIIRGTGTDGLGGMEPVREDISGYRIIRPLLSEWKEDILKYCEKRNLSPRFDHTNEEPRYMRNKIRLEVIPKLEELNPDFKKAVLRLAESASEDTGMLRSMAEFSFSSGLAREGKGQEPADMMSGINTSWPGDAPEGAVRLCRSVRDLDPSVARRVFKLALEKVGLTQDVTHAHYKAIEALLSSEVPSAETELPYGYKVRREYDELVFLAPEKEENALPTMKTRICRVVDGEPAEDELSEATCQGKYAIFDADALRDQYGEDFPELLEMRYRRPGDHMAISRGTKKIQDLFVDMKIPKHMRDRVPMCCLGGEVLFIPAKSGAFTRARYSKKYAASKGTKRVFIIEVIG